MLPAFTDDNGLGEYIKKRWNKCQTENEDSIIVIAGGERKGKSTLALRIVYQLCKKQFFHHGKPDVDDISIEGKGFISWLRHSEKMAGVFDEAGTAMYTRDAMKPIVKMINKRLMVCGYKYLFIILCLPSIFDLDTHVRNRRINCLIQITKKGDFVAYNRKGAIAIGKSKDWRAAKPLTYGHWNNQPMDADYQKVVDLYRIKEKRHKDAYMAGDLDDEIYNRNIIIAKLVKDGKYKQVELAPIFGLDKDTINKINAKFSKFII